MRRMASCFGETRTYPERTWAQNRSQIRENLQMTISIRIIYVYMCFCVCVCVCVKKMSLSRLKILASKARLSAVKEAIAYFHDLPASYIETLSVSWYSPLPVFLLVISFNIRPSLYETLSLETHRSCSH